MATMETPLLPGMSWTEGNTLTTATGARLRRFGSVQMACKILDDCDRHVIYELRDSGLIKGYKRRSDRINSHLRIDLLSVWEYKQRQLAGH